MSCAQRALGSGVVCADAAVAMPARTTASIMAERRTKGCIQILTTKDDHKTPDHFRLERPHLRALSPDKWVRRCDLAPLSRKFHMAACVGRLSAPQSPYRNSVGGPARGVHSALPVHSYS